MSPKTYVLIPSEIRAWQITSNYWYYCRPGDAAMQDIGHFVASSYDLTFGLLDAIIQLGIYSALALAARVGGMCWATLNGSHDGYLECSTDDSLFDENKDFAETWELVRACKWQVISCVSGLTWPLLKNWPKPGFMLVKVQPKSAFPGLLLHGKGIDGGMQFRCMWIKCIDAANLGYLMMFKF